MSLKHPLWIRHFTDDDLRISETDGGTFRVMVPGGQIEISRSKAEKLIDRLSAALGIDDEELDDE